MREPYTAPNACSQETYGRHYLCDANRALTRAVHGDRLHVISTMNAMGLAEILHAPYCCRPMLDSSDLNAWERNLAIQCIPEELRKNMTNLYACVQRGIAQSTSMQEHLMLNVFVAGYEIQNDTWHKMLISNGVCCTWIWMHEDVASSAVCVKSFWDARLVSTVEHCSIAVLGSVLLGKCISVKVVFDTIEQHGLQRAVIVATAIRSSSSLLCHSFDAARKTQFITEFHLKKQVLLLGGYDVDLTYLVQQDTGRYEHNIDDSTSMHKILVKMWRNCNSSFPQWVLSLDCWQDLTRDSCLALCSRVSFCGLVRLVCEPICMPVAMDDSGREILSCILVVCDGMRERRLLVDEGTISSLLCSLKDAEKDSLLQNVISDLEQEENALWRAWEQTFVSIQHREPLLWIDTTVPDFSVFTHYKPTWVQHQELSAQEKWPETLSSRFAYASWVRSLACVSHNVFFLKPCSQPSISVPCAQGKNLQLLARHATYVLLRICQNCLAMYNNTPFDAANSICQLEMELTFNTWRNRLHNPSIAMFGQDVMQIVFGFLPHSSYRIMSMVNRNFLRLAGVTAYGYNEYHQICIEKLVTELSSSDTPPPCLSASSVGSAMSTLKFGHKRFWHRRFAYNSLTDYVWTQAAWARQLIGDPLYERRKGYGIDDGLSRALQYPSSSATLSVSQHGNEINYDMANITRLLLKYNSRIQDCNQKTCIKAYCDLMEEFPCNDITYRTVHCYLRDMSPLTALHNRIFAEVMLNRSRQCILNALSFLDTGGEISLYDALKHKVSAVVNDTHPQCICPVFNLRRFCDQSATCMQDFLKNVSIQLLEDFFGDDWPDTASRFANNTDEDFFARWGSSLPYDRYIEGNDTWTFTQEIRDVKFGTCWYSIPVDARDPLSGVLDESFDPTISKFLHVNNANESTGSQDNDVYGMCVLVLHDTDTSMPVCIRYDLLQHLLLHLESQSMLYDNGDNRVRRCRQLCKLLNAVVRVRVKLVDPVLFCLDRDTPTHLIDLYRLYGTSQNKCVMIGYCLQAVSIELVDAAWYNANTNQRDVMAHSMYGAGNVLDTDESYFGLQVGPAHKRVFSEVHSAWPAIGCYE